MFSGDSMINARRRRKATSPIKVSDEENIDPIPASISKKIKFTHSLPSDVSPKKLDSKNSPQKSSTLAVSEIKEPEPVSKPKKSNEVKRNRKGSSNLENLEDPRLDIIPIKASSSDSRQEVVSIFDSAKPSLVDEIDTGSLFLN